MKRIAIFASGNGSNAENLITQLGAEEGYSFPLIICDNLQAGIWERGKRLGVRCLHFSRKELSEGATACQLLKEEKIDWIILAGFLGKISGPLLEEFGGRIVNIHPALLPRFGGKGMYGHHVHEAVLQQRENLSGITIHFVDAEYDHGATICQVTCPVYPDTDTPDLLAERIHRLEHIYFPVVVRDLLQRAD